MSDLVVTDQKNLSLGTFLLCKLVAFDTVGHTVATVVVFLLFIHNAGCHSA